MEDSELQTSPQIYARIGGVLYLIIIVFGIFGEAFVRGGLIVSGNPSATAEKIITSERLWRLSWSTLISGSLMLSISLSTSPA